MKQRVLMPVLGILITVLATSCPKPVVNNNIVSANPPFFADAYPNQGPWKIDVKAEMGAYQKLYVHDSEDAIITATFVRINEHIEIDVTDPRNQQALAESAMNNFCSSIGAQCLVDSADLAWIVGTPVQYIYVRFHAVKKNLPQMQGLIYYRFDPAYGGIQTMYLLLSDGRVYDSFETAFLNYLSRVEFHPEKF